jgi:CheY-like chemotaxis protein
VIVLVAHPSAPDRKRLCAILTTKGHTVIEANTLTTVQTHVQNDWPEVLLLDWSMLDATGPSAISYLRDSSIDQPRVYVIAMSARASADDFRAVEKAGIDDLLRMPILPEELLMRVRAPERIATWAGSQSRNHCAHALSKIPAWNELETLIGREMSEMFGCDLVRGDYSASEIVHASHVAISIVYDRVEIRLALGIDAVGTRALVAHLLAGDSRPEAVADALRELANVAAGAFKRAAIADGARVAVSIPTDQNLFATGEGRRWTLRGDNSLSLACASIARSIPPKRVPASKLEEGMVVIRDVRSPAGALLLPAGTSLTSVTARRLAGALGSSGIVEVSDLVS